jgi:hypothetical protein
VRDDDLYFQFELTRKLGYRSRREMLATIDRREYLLWKGYRAVRVKMMQEVSEKGKTLIEW